jgi:DtxR family Mn-dependent transcriptional regulator
MNSENVENYLTAIFRLTRESSTASTSALAEHLGLTAGSVTGMLKRLSDQGLVEHVPYYGSQLTPRGRAQALTLVRRHRLIEQFLVQVLGYAWDSVHAEAERLEHAVSDDLVDRMAAVLGHPSEDPHGAPIPLRGQAWEEPVLPSLEDLEPGSRAVLRRVPDEDAETLRYLARLHVVPGTVVTVIERTPCQGPLRIRVGDAEHYLGLELSRQLRVEPLSAAKEAESVGGLLTGRSS